MGYTVEDINSCTKKIVFDFTDVDLSKQISEALKERQKSANLKGFRKGKAPLSMIEQVYGDQVKNDALYRFVSQEFYKAIKEEDLKAIGYPSFAKTNYEDDKKKVSFEATVEIFPTVNVRDYSKYEFKLDSDEVTDKDFLDLKERYMSPKAQMLPVEDKTRTLENGLFAVMNFEGEKPDGSRPENMKASEFLLEIGSGQFIPGFEEAMVGMKTGEKKTIEVTFPADYHEEDLKNAKCKFDVEVLEIKERKLPELTDEMAKEFGFESAADFETKNKERLVQQKKREVKSKLHQEILEKLVEENSFDVPFALLEQQKEGVKKDLESNLKAQGFNDAMVKTYFEKWDQDVQARADFQVRSGLILDSLATKFNIEATDADLDAKIAEMAASSGMDVKQIENYYKGNEQIKTNLMYAIREEKTFDKLVSEMRVK